MRASARHHAGIAFRLPWLLLIFLCLGVPVVAAGNPKQPGSTTFFVDPSSGNDHNPGTQAAPFRTITAARDAVRSINSKQTQDIVVTLRGGDYLCTEFATTESRAFQGGGTTPDGTYSAATALVFEPKDSGQNGFDIIYRAYPGETPVLHGGRTLSGWVLHDAKKNIWRTKVPPGARFRQFYVDGLRGERARLKTLPADLTFDPDAGFRTTDRSLANLKNQQNIELVMQVKWCNHRALVENIHAENSNTALITPQNSVWTRIINETWARLESADELKWIENAYEFLSAEGEWYHDKPAGVVYYIPRPGQSMPHATAVIPAVDELVVLRGTSLDKPVHNLRFEGISFAYSNWIRPSDAGYYVNQANYHRDSDRQPEAAFTAIYSHDIQLLRCSFAHMGSTAVLFKKSVRDVRVEGCSVIDSAGNGIFLCPHSDSNNALVREDPRWLFRDSQICNNYLENTSQDYRSGVAITVGWGQNLTINHNEITNAPYGGINAGWHNGGHEIVRNVEIGYNRIETIEYDGMEDNGAIYTLGATAGDPANPGYHIVGNYLRSQMKYHAPLYMDNHSSWWLAERNVIDFSAVALGNMKSVAGYQPIWAYAQQHNTAFNNTLRDNYTTTKNLNIRHGKDCIAIRTKVNPFGLWLWGKPAKIIKNAGLEPQFQDIRPHVRNLVENPHFSYLNTDVWKPKSAAFTQVHTTKARGTQSGALRAKAKTIRLSQWLRLPSWGIYHASAWVKGRAGLTVTLRLGPWTVARTELSDDHWVFLEGDAASPWGFLPLSVSYQGTKPGEVVYIDEVFVN